MEETKSNLRPAHEIVLNALAVGKEITLGGQKIVMQDGQIYIPMTSYDTNTNESEDWLYDFDVPVNWFLRECAKIPDADLFVMAGETALMKMNRERARKRTEWHDKKVKEE